MQIVSLGFAWNVNVYFMGKIRNIFQIVVYRKYYPARWAFSTNQKRSCTYEDRGLTSAPTPSHSNQGSSLSVVRLVIGYCRIHRQTVYSMTRLRRELTDLFILYHNIRAQIELRSHDLRVYPGHSKIDNVQFSCARAHIRPHFSQRQITCYEQSSVQRMGKTDHECHTVDFCTCLRGYEKYSDSADL